MSVKVMGLVWDLALPSSEKLVLLAYADHADHDGNNIWPSIDLVSRKTGLSRRTVQRTTAKLEAKKLMELSQKGGGTGRTNRWRIPLENLQTSDWKGDTVTRLTPVKVSSSPRKVSPDPSKGVTMTPEPSLTINNHHRKEDTDKDLLTFLQMNMNPHGHLLGRGTVFVAADTGNLNIYTSSEGKRQHLARPGIQAMMQDAMEGYAGYSGKIEIW